MSAVAEMLFFAFIDPGELDFFGTPIELGRTDTYSLFFLFSWMAGACSSAFTCFLPRSPFEVNRCPIDTDGRPAGCPKRFGGTCCE